MIRTHPLLEHWGTPFFLLVFASLLFLQWRYPLRRQHFSRWRRAWRNIFLSAPSFALARLSLVPIPLLAAIWADHHQFGLFHWLPLPRGLAVVLGVLAMDYAYYWWHVALHLVPFLWRFHNVHHSDLDMDVTTAVRFHFGEVILSVPFRVSLVLALGLDLWALVLFELIFETLTFFEHSNWRLPLRLERVLNQIFVTPRMHGIHHSIVERETNSNWGTVFCWWDRLHRSLRRDIAQGEITIGVAAFRDETELTFGRLFLLPFQKQRPWRLPSGEVPERAVRPATELEL